MATPVAVVEELKGKEPRDVIELIKKHNFRVKKVSQGFHLTKCSLSTMISWNRPLQIYMVWKSDLGRLIWCTENKRKIKQNDSVLQTWVKTLYIWGTWWTIWKMNCLKTSSWTDMLQFKISLQSQRIKNLKKSCNRWTQVRCPNFPFRIGLKVCSQHQSTRTMKRRI